MFKLSCLIDFENKYTTKELEQIFGLSSRHFQREIKKGNLRATVRPKAHGGYSIKGIDFIDWVFKYHCNDIFEFKEI